jgi:hypothetical protein
MDAPTNHDLSLDDDLAALRHEAQKAVDREVAARAELAAAIENRQAVRAKLAAGSSDALAFIDAYVNPTIPNPGPIAPEVAAPPPAIEPPVFTTVSDEFVAPDNSSGGAAPVDEALTVVEPVSATNPGAAESDGADKATGK